MSRLIVIVLGYLCLVIGFIGLFVPVLQGVLFLAIGLMLLAPHQPWAGRMIKWLEKKFPSFRAVRVPARRRMQLYMRKINKRFAQRQSKD